MNLGQAIIARWASDSTLNGLLASTRVMVHRHEEEEPARPYAVLVVGGGDAGLRLNGGAGIRGTAAVITIVCDKETGDTSDTYGGNGYDQCKAIAEAVQRAFDNQTWDLSGNDRVLLCRTATPTEDLDEDSGQWMFSITLDTDVYTASGV